MAASFQFLHIHIVHLFAAAAFFSNHQKKIKNMAKRKMTNFGKKLKDAGISLYRVSVDTGVAWMTLKSWAAGRRTPRVSGALTDVITYLEDKHGIDITFNDFKL